MDNFGFEIAETARLVRREANRRFSGLGATGAQWRVLARLTINNGARQVELAEALDVEPITLCRMVDRLAEAGLVERRPDPADRRAWRIHLTEAAAPLMAELETLGAGLNEELLAGVAADELAVARRVLERVRANLDAVGREMEAAS